MYEFYIVKTKEKNFICSQLCYKSFNSDGLTSLYLNGVKGGDTWLPNWATFKGDLTSVQQMGHVKHVNKRYELKDPSLESEKFPLTVPAQDAENKGGYDEDDDYYQPWFAEISSLYTNKHDVEEAKLEDVEYKIVETLEVDTVKEPGKFAYIINRGQWASDGFTEVTEKDVEHQLADKLMFPEIVMGELPCKLSSEQSYKIIRKFIQDNIDSGYAEITSDYDFCFTVKKKIHLVERKEWTVDVNNGPFQKRKRKPKYEKRYAETKSVPIFEMTHAGSNYSGYTSIPGFSGTSHDNLKEVIDEYLNDLLSEINTPLAECKDCCGRGVVGVKSLEHPTKSES